MCIRDSSGTACRLDFDGASRPRRNGKRPHVASMHGPSPGETGSMEVAAGHGAVPGAPRHGSAISSATEARTTSWVSRVGSESGRAAPGTRKGRRQRMGSHPLVMQHPMMSTSRRDPLFSTVRSSRGVLLESEPIPTPGMPISGFGLSVTFRTHRRPACRLSGEPPGLRGRKKQ